MINNNYFVQETWIKQGAYTTVGFLTERDKKRKS